MAPPILRKSSSQRVWPQGRATSGAHWFRQMGQSASTKTIRPQLLLLDCLRQTGHWIILAIKWVLIRLGRMIISIMLSLSPQMPSSNIHSRFLFLSFVRFEVVFCVSCDVPRRPQMVSRVTCQVSSQHYGLIPRKTSLFNSYLAIQYSTMYRSTSLFSSYESTRIQ